MNAAVARLQTALFGKPCSAAESAAAGLSTVRISVASTSEWPPRRPGSTIEAYTLDVSEAEAQVAANSTAGALHALRTLSQLLAPSASGASIDGLPLRVVDVPFYGHRGIMLDTARHFLPLDTIQRTVRAAAASGMNALHLHLTDAQSFPLEVPSLPLLAEKGAYAASARYSPKDLADLTSYAGDFGVTIIPEVDMPGHAYSFGLGYPNSTANCPGYAHNINNIPLNPAVQFTADLVQDVLGALAAAFPGELVHIGGDEVVLGCWSEDASVQRFMKENGWTSTTQVLQFFVTQADAIVEALPAGDGRDAVARALGAGRRRPVHWQDLFDNGVKVSPNSVYQVWRSLDDVAPITAAGFDVVASAEDSGWYLNCGFNTGCAYSSWEQVYQTNIEAAVAPGAKGKLLGGEAVLFGEFANAPAVDAQLWPRAAAIAERLWVPTAVNNTDVALPRLTAHACRLQAMGVGSAPTGPGWCDEAAFVPFA